LVLEDVRPGDLLEYSYTLIGENPALAGQYERTLRLCGPQPIARLEHRLLWTPGRRLGIANHDTDLQPRVVRTESTWEYRWSAHDLPRIELEDDVPIEFDPYPSVQLTGFQSWEEVAPRPCPLSAPPARIWGSLRRVIGELRASAPTPERQALAAIRFVQEQVRYLGIEMGVGSHRPTDPNEVARRRFGDCKDKALLLA